MTLGDARIPGSRALEHLEDLTDLGYEIADVDNSDGLLLVTLRKGDLCAVVPLEGDDWTAVLKDFVIR